MRSLLLLAAVGLALVGVLDASDPLNRLERQAQAFPAYAAAVELPLDEAFYWSAKRVEAVLEQQLGAHVLYGAPTVEGAAGETLIPLRVITIDASQHWTARFETLGHEAAHLLSPPILLPTDEDVFAEGVAYLVAAHDGDRGALRRSAHYLAGLKASLHILRDYRTEILRAAHFLE